MSLALLALFGIDNSSVNLALNFLLLFLVVIYLALVYWTYADARRRLADPVLVGTATLTALIPFLGPMIYTILRPPEFIEDVRERQLETRASELRLRRLTETSCPRCEHPIERDWLTCPECRTNLKDPCGSCGRAVDPNWSVCPHCQSPVAREGQAPGQRPGRRRSSGSKAAPAQGSRSQAKPSQSPPKSRPTTSRQASARVAAAKRSAPRDGEGESSGAQGGRPTRRPRPRPEQPEAGADGASAPKPSQASQQRPAGEPGEEQASRPRRRSTPTN